MKLHLHMFPTISPLLSHHYLDYVLAAIRQQAIFWTNSDLDYNAILCIYDFNHQGAVSIRKTVLPGMAIPMLKIRRPNGRLIFNMEIAIRR